MKSIKVLIFIIFLVSVVLSVYSYALTDLNLTLSSNKLILQFQHQLQQLGFYNRGLSTILFLVFCLIFIFFYILLCKRPEILRGMQKLAVIVLVGPLLFSYSAFISYDIFNYIFDSRIITLYHQNPYQFSALHFPGDPMLHFMRWTHRSYPYGPLWLLPGVVITLITQKLLLQIFFFKLVTILAAAISDYLLSNRLKSQSLLLIFNPLIVFEVLLSSHNDIFVVMFSVLALVFFTRNKLSQTFLFLGGSIKFINFFLIPAFLFFKEKSQNFYLFSIFLICLSILAASIRTEFQIWYLLWLLPFAYLLKKGGYIRNLIILNSIILPISYAPYIYSGSYDGLSFYLKYILLAVSIPLAIIIRKTMPKLL